MARTPFDDTRLSRVSVVHDSERKMASLRMRHPDHFDAGLLPVLSPGGGQVFPPEAK